jgi:hypothetical protein
MGDQVFLVVSGDEMKTLLVFTAFLSATTSSAQSTYNEKEWREIYWPQFQVSTFFA